MQIYHSHGVQISWLKKSLKRQKVTQKIIKKSRTPFFEVIYPSNSRTVAHINFTTSRRWRAY